MKRRAVSRQPSAVSRQLSAVRGRVAAVISAARGVKALSPNDGRVVDAPMSALAEYFAGDLTPEKIKAALRAGAYGDPITQNEIFDTLLDRDATLSGIYATRKLAITGLDWELQPANEVGKHPKINEKIAANVHEYCAEVLAEIAGFDAAVNELSDAIGRSISVAEMEYAGGLPIAMHTIPPPLLYGDSMRPDRLRVRASDNDWQGVLLDEFPAGKWIIHQPATIGGSRFRGGLLRPAMVGFMLKRMGLKGLAVFIELFGLPTVIAKYGSADDASTRSELLRMVRDLGINRGGVFPAGCEIIFAESKVAGSTGGLPQLQLMQYVDAEYSIEFLGQTLTTQMGQTGSYAAAQVHNEVRADLRDNDIRNEGSTIREQLLIPVAVAKFGDTGRMHAPYFRRIVEEAKDLGATATLIGQAVNELGAPVPMSIVSTQLGLPLVDGTDETEPLPGRQAAANPFAISKTVGRQPSAVGRCKCGREHGRVLSSAGSAVSPLNVFGGWMGEAVEATNQHTAKVIAVIQAYIEQRGDLAAALAGLPELLAQLPIEDLAAIEQRYLTAGQLAGRESLRQQATGQIASKRRNAETRKRRNSRIPQCSTRIICAEGTLDFAAIPFEQAIRMLRQRLGIDPETFAELEAAARSRAWRVAGVWNMRLLAQVHDELLNSIESGETARDFRLRLPDMADRNGWSGENPWHGTIVQFQNFAMAHAAGRAAEYQQYDVPHWRYVVYDESTACPICGPLNGKVFASDDRTYWPPLHFNCRCMDEPVFEGEAQPGEATDSDSVNVPALDDEQERPGGFAWDVSQYANLEPVDLGAFPEGLRPAFEAFAKQQGWEVTE